MARATKAALAASNVFALPCAAPRQINNYRFAEQRRAAVQAYKSSPFLGRYVHHQAREADRLAAELSTIEQTPALLIASAMLRAMDNETVKRVIEALAPGVVAGSKPHTQAVATIKTSRLCIGEQSNLLRAIDRLREGR